MQVSGLIPEALVEARDLRGTTDTRSRLATFPCDRTLSSARHGRTRSGHPLGRHPSTGLAEKDARNKSGHAGVGGVAGPERTRTGPQSDETPSQDSRDRGQPYDGGRRGKRCAVGPRRHAANRPRLSAIGPMRAPSTQGGNDETAVGCWDRRFDRCRLRRVSVRRRASRQRQRDREGGLSDQGTAGVECSREGGAPFTARWRSPLGCNAWTSRAPSSISTSNAFRGETARLTRAIVWAAFSSARDPFPRVRLFRHTPPPHPGPLRPQGRRGRASRRSHVPPPPSGGRGTGGGGFVVYAAFSSGTKWKALPIPRTMVRCRARGAWVRIGACADHYSARVSAHYSARVSAHYSARVSARRSARASRPLQA